MLGTHTHVATADEQILKQGTAYQTDVGMTGPHDSILGRRYDRVLTATLTFVPAYFDVATGDPRLNGALRDGRSRDRPRRDDPAREHRPGRGPPAPDRDERGAARAHDDRPVTRLTEPCSDPGRSGSGPVMDRRSPRFRPGEDGGVSQILEPGAGG